MKKAIIVSGYFNPIHKGHLELFEKSKALGDMLIVIVNSDLQRFLKGSKEFQKEDERLLIVKAIKYVDYVIPFNENTPIKLIKEIEPDYLVKGGDYKAEDIVGKEFAKKTLTIPFVKNYSTTSTIKKIKQN